MNFLDSIPTISRKCAELKDVVAVCDDYFPSTSRQESMEMQKRAEKLISLCSDKMTGGRSKSNGEMRKTYRAKGQVIATGELFPELSQSRMSRVFFLNLKKGDVNDSKLKDIQNHQEELQYAMKKYIEYIISNMDEIERKIPKIFDEKTHEVNEILQSFRTAEMVTALYIGYSFFIEFVILNEVITEEEGKKMIKESLETLIEVGKEQNNMVESISPINMLLNAVEVLSSTGKLVTVDSNSAPFMKREDVLKEGFIGFYDEKDDVNLIYPDILYKAVKRFYNEQNVEFPLNKTAMCKELMLKGYLYRTEKQDRPQIRRQNPITKKEETFIGILPNKIYIRCRYNDEGIIREK